MIWLIADRLERGHCDDVLEVAWSTMWNVTDETPSNCRRFLEMKGMEYFLMCLEVTTELKLIVINYLIFFFFLEIPKQGRVAAQHDGSLRQRSRSPRTPPLFSYFQILNSLFGFIRFDK